MVQFIAEIDRTTFKHKQWRLEVHGESVFSRSFLLIARFLFMHFASDLGKSKVNARDYR